MQAIELAKELKDVAAFLVEAFDLLKPFAAELATPAAEFFKQNSKEKDDLKRIGFQLFSILGAQAVNFAGKLKDLAKGDEATVKEFAGYLEGAKKVKKFVEDVIGLVKGLFQKFKAFLAKDDAKEQKKDKKDGAANDDVFVCGSGGPEPVRFSKANKPQPKQAKKGVELKLEEDLDAAKKEELKRKFYQALMAKIEKLNATGLVNWNLEQEGDLYTCKSDDLTCNIDLSKGFNASVSEVNAQSIEMLLSSAEAYQAAMPEGAAKPKMELTCDSEETALEVLSSPTAANINIACIKIDDPNNPGKTITLTADKVAELKAKAKALEIEGPTKGMALEQTSAGDAVDSRKTLKV